MITVDLAFATFNLTLTLGAVDTNNPPPLLLEFLRHGTNFSGTFDLSTVAVHPGDRYVSYTNIPTSIFTDPQGEKQSGQYEYQVLDNTIPADPVLIEKGLLMVLTTPITKTDYGTDKARGEYKGHL